MAKGANLIVYEFERDIINVVNNCGLQPTIIKQVIGRIYNEVSILANNAVQKEAEEHQKELEKEKQSEDEKELEENGE